VLGWVDGVRNCWADDLHMPLSMSVLLHYPPLQGPEAGQHAAGQAPFACAQSLEVMVSSEPAVPPPQHTHTHPKHTRRDLKLDNTLLEDKLGPACVRICDFGFARAWKESDNMKTAIGTPVYMSPQVGVLPTWCGVWMWAWWGCFGGGG
jgi:serine/threonine protein kinase